MKLIKANAVDRAICSETWSRAWFEIFISSFLIGTRWKIDVNEKCTAGNLLIRCKNMNSVDICRQSRRHGAFLFPAFEHRVLLQFHMLSVPVEAQTFYWPPRKLEKKSWRSLKSMFLPSTITARREKRLKTNISFNDIKINISIRFALWKVKLFAFVTISSSSDVCSLWFPRRTRWLLLWSDRNMNRAKRSKHLWFWFAVTFTVLFGLVLIFFGL